MSELISEIRNMFRRKEVQATEKRFVKKDELTERLRKLATGKADETFVGKKEIVAGFKGGAREFVAMVREAQENPLKEGLSEVEERIEDSVVLRRTGIGFYSSRNFINKDIEGKQGKIRNPRNTEVIPLRGEIVGAKTDLKGNLIVYFILPQQEVQRVAVESADMVCEALAEKGKWTWHYPAKDKKGNTIAGMRDVVAYSTLLSADMSPDFNLNSDIYTTEEIQSIKLIIPGI